MTPKNVKRKPVGLGDTIASVTKATGIDKVAKFVAKAAGKKDCGCKKRQDKLNQKFPYRSNNR
jgi:hypothetical protein